MTFQDRKSLHQIFLYARSANNILSRYVKAVLLRSIASLGDRVLIRLQGSDPGICASCQYFTDIYMWPSISASRLESLESLVLFLMPCKSGVLPKSDVADIDSTHGRVSSSWVGKHT
jgi:hypothetical protein